MELRRRLGIVLVGSCCAWCLGTAAVSAETPTKVTIKPLEDRVAVQGDGSSAATSAMDVTALILIL